MVGMLLFSAFSGFSCRKCGKIPKSEFPPNVQAKMTAGTVIMAVVAVVLLVTCVVLLIVFEVV
jgi:hypothetical protein